MLRPTVFLVSAALGLVSNSGLAASLPDTGQDTCYNDTGADTVPANSPTSIDKDTGTHPRQDCRYGRDPAANAGQLTKLGGGAKGFDYSKIANNGTNLGAAPAATLGTNPSDWACTLDNVTGLMWEVKTPGPAIFELRSMYSTYTWYNSDPTTNGGNAGTAGTIGGLGNCATLGACDTEKFVAVVNTPPGLCGHTDWRMPTVRELQTLIHFGVTPPSIDTTYFPNTLAWNFWSGSSSAAHPSLAFMVDFNGSGTAGEAKSFAPGVRLVRGGQF